MKITNIRVTPVNIPLELPMLWTAGFYPGTDKAIIEVEAMGVGFWCYSGDAGICTAAYLHVTAALQWIHEPAQSLLRWQIGDVIQGGPFKPKNNIVPVPEGPGLGVELDQDALSYWHQHYVANEPMDHFCDPEKPGHFRCLPLN